MLKINKYIIIIKMYLNTNDNILNTYMPPSFELILPHSEPNWKYFIASI
jgi:hypothetical protein